MLGLDSAGIAKSISECMKGSKSLKGLKSLNV